MFRPCPHLHFRLHNQLQARMQARFAAKTVELGTRRVRCSAQRRVETPRGKAHLDCHGGIEPLECSPSSRTRPYGQYKPWWRKKNSCRGCWTQEGPNSRKEKTEGNQQNFNGGVPLPNALLARFPRWYDEPTVVKTLLEKPIDSPCQSSGTPTKSNVRDPTLTLGGDAAATARWSPAWHDENMAWKSLMQRETRGEDDRKRLNFGGAAEDSTVTQMCKTHAKDKARPQRIVAVQGITLWH